MKTMESEILRETVEHGREKMDSALAVAARGRSVKLV